MDLRDAVIGDAEPIGELITELGYPTTPEAMRDRLTMAGQGARDVVVNSGLHRAEAHGFYERRGYSRTDFRFVKQLDGPR